MRIQNPVFMPLVVHNAYRYFMEETLAKNYDYSKFTGKIWILPIFWVNCLK